MEKKEKVWPTFLIVLISLAVTLLTVYGVWRVFQVDARIDKEGWEEATVVTENISTSSNDDGYDIVLRGKFEFQGKKYPASYATSGSSEDTFKKGETFTIFFNPNDPTEYSTNARLGILYRVLLILVPIIVAGIAVLISYRSLKRQFSKNASVLVE